MLRGWGGVAFRVALVATVVAFVVGSGGGANNVSGSLVASRLQSAGHIASIDLEDGTVDSHSEVVNPTSIVTNGIFTDSGSDDTTVQIRLLDGSNCGNENNLDAPVSFASYTGPGTNLGHTFSGLTPHQSYCIEYDLFDGSSTNSQVVTGLLYPGGAPVVAPPTPDYTDVGMGAEDQLGSVVGLAGSVAEPILLVVLVVGAACLLVVWIKRTLRK